MQRKSLLVLLLALILGMILPATADTFTMTVPKEVQPYKTSDIRLSFPEDGYFQLYLDGREIESVITEFTVQRGEMILPFEGLAWGDMPIRKGKHTLYGQFTGEDGQIYEQEAALQVKAAKAVLQYALPGAETLFLGDPSWFVDCGISASGTIIVEIAGADAPGDVIHKISTKAGKDDMYRIPWKGKVGKKNVEPGSYLVSVYLKEDPDNEITFPLTVVEGEEKQPLAVTEALLPVSVEDDAVWAKMMEPLVVVDIVYKDHQPIYGEPSMKGKTLGTVHGQTQGVQVLSTANEEFTFVGAWRHEDGEYIEGYIPTKLLKTVTPNTHYGILIDKAAQTMTVYEEGTPIGTLPVSTGLMKKGALDRETRAGSFLISDRIRTFTRNDLQYEYALRFDGGNLISQIGYVKKNSGADFSSQLPFLGVKATDACVWVDYRGSAQSDINAYWLYSHIESGTKVIILDDPQQRRETLAEIDPKAAPAVSAKSEKILTATPYPLSEAEKDQYDKVLISLAGDCVLGGEEKTRKSERSFDSVVAEKGYEWPFSGVSSYFLSDDHTLVNLEVVLQDDKTGMQTDKMHVFRGATDYANMLVLAGIEQVNVANNHFIDYNTSGRRSTRQALTAAGVAYSGYGDVYTVEVGGYKIGFGGIRETIYRQKKTIMEEDIRALQDAGCDVIVYSCHFGTEYERNHNKLQSEMAHQAVDLGAHIVVGHHAHVVQGIESYNGGLILYGLGNFVFGGNLDLTEFDAYMAQVELLFDSGRYHGVELRVIPVLTTGTMPANDYRPVVAEGEDKVRIMKKIQDDTLFTLSEAMFFPAVDASSQP